MVQQQVEKLVHELRRFSEVAALGAVQQKVLAGHGVPNARGWVGVESLHVGGS